MKERKPAAKIPQRGWATSLVLMLLLVVPGPVGALAQDTSTVTIGDSQLTYTDDWELLGEDGTDVTLQRSQQPVILFDYSVHPDSTRRASDPHEFIVARRIEPLERLDFLGNIHLAGSGSLPDGTVWELYSMTVNRMPVFYLVAVNVDLEPGVDIVSSMVTTMDGVIAAHFAVSEEITVDGDPTLIARIDSSDVLRPAMEEIMYMDGPRVPAPPAGPAS